MSPKLRKILVTSALPYANASIHLGHMVEHVQTDIWVRFQRLSGHDVVSICASDAHGTPAMLSARKAGTTPEELTERFRAEHQRSFSRFFVDYDNYYTTHSPENRALVGEIFARLDRKGLIARRTIKQAYDAEAGMFLPDRFVKGTCPVCKSADQYGDNCEVCGATYSPADLIDPRSVLSGTPPTQKDSEHLFFRLGEFEDSLKRWHAAGHVDESVARKLKEWFDTGLRDWDISRDAPYFGFPIPGTGSPGAETKYFYVWVDAPVGYMASFLNYCNSPEGRARNLAFDDYWQAGATTELYHFIGKDIIYFHTLFWPAVLEGAGFRKPTAVHAHGFLTVNGQKMSKSRGTFIAADTYTDHLDPEYLRYYFAVKLGPNVDDIDLNLEDFVARVNSDLVGKFVNLASRCAGFISQKFDGRLADTLDAAELQAEFAGAGTTIGRFYEQREYGKAMREIMALADRANRYIDDCKPWVLARDPDSLPRVQTVCTQGLNLFRLLTIYLKPVLPGVAEKAERFLGTGPLRQDDRHTPLLGTRIGPYEPLLLRVDPAAVTRMVDASMERQTERQTAQQTESSATKPDQPAAATPAAKSAEESAAQIDIAEFQRLDLRIATVLAAEAVEGADKLVRLRLDVGSGERTVLSGIKAAYPPEKLVGRQVVLVANLKPRKMRFGVSEGMVLAASGDAGLFLVGADSGATPGMKVS